MAAGNVSGIYELGKRFAIFMTIVSAVDTALIVGATASGTKLPSFAYFAPPQLINYLYNFDKSISNMSFTNLFAFFVFIMAINAIVLLVNFLIGVVAGGPLLAYALASSLGSFPNMIGVLAAATAILTFLQAIAMVYILYVFLGITLP